MSIAYVENDVVQSIYPQDRNSNFAKGDDIKQYSYLLQMYSVALADNDLVYFAWGEGRVWALLPCNTSKKELDRSMLLLEVDTSAQSYTSTLLQGNLAYEFWERTKWQDQDKLVLQSDIPLQGKPMEKVFAVPYGQLLLKLTPVEGWYRWEMVLYDIVVSIIFSLLFTIAVLLLHDLLAERKNYEALAEQDVLTGLLNRRKFITTVEEACRHKQPFLLCYIDFDKFKSVNDTYGHHVGDEVLRQCAKRIREAIKSEGKLFRLGGDEFVAYLQDPGTEETRQQLMENIMAVTAEPLVCYEHEIKLSISVGYVLYPRDAETSEALLNMADKRMYEDKKRHYLGD